MFRPLSLSFASFCFLVFIIAGCGGGGGGQTSPPPAQVSVTISPTSTTVTAGNNLQFNASVSGTTNVAVTWSVSGGSSNGTISTTGLYFAPTTVPTPAQVTVTATSQADSSKSASASVTVQIGVQVEPSTVTLQVLATQQFFVNVAGTSNPAVTWSVVGGTANGTITASGAYTAPATVPTPPQVTVKAISQVDTTQSGTATVTVIPVTPSITIQPNPAAASVFSTQQFAAFPQNLSSNAVTWQVNGVNGGSQQTGFITSSGLYIAPGAVPTVSNGSGQSTPITVTVTAVSAVNPAVSGSAALTVNNSTAQNLTTYLGMSGGNQLDSQISGNSIYCCSGTLGSLVTRGGTSYILSNNHILARTDLGNVTTGNTPGDNIIQPGLIDSNCGQGIFDIIANLFQFYNLETGPAPKIDAALALPVQSGVVDAQGRILYLGATTDSNNVPLPDAPHGGSGLPETSALLSTEVAKSGRTTGLTCSSIFSISTSVSIQYQQGCSSGTTFEETFTNQIDVSGGSFSAPGDSGSLIVTQDTADPVALLFASSDQDSVGNPVGDVLNYFQSGGNAVTFVGGGTHQVIGCTLPAAPTSAVLTVPLSAVGSQDLLRATQILDANAEGLMAHPEVQAVGIGASLDHSGEPAILLFVTKGQPRIGIPATVGGIRTRVIEGNLFSPRGVVSAEQSEALEKSAPAPQNVYAISESEFARAKTIHTEIVNDWMNKPGVQGVGIGSSTDSPGEAALVIFLVRGVAHEPIPPVINGLRTRIRESTRFRAGFGDERSQRPCSVRGRASKGRAS